MGALDQYGNFSGFSPVQTVNFPTIKQLISGWGSSAEDQNADGKFNTLDFAAQLWYMD